MQGEVQRERDAEDLRLSRGSRGGRCGSRLPLQDEVREEKKERPVD